MIASEFLAELRQISGLFDWKLAPDAERAPERRSAPRFSIRASRKTGPEGTLLDPIGAVCSTQTGQTYPVESWIEAAKAMELSLIDAADLVAATNDRTWRQLEGRREPDPYMVGLRKRLEAAIGLDPDAAADGDA
jgi:hypothetical protein